jgi:hypothetical protein
MHVICGEGYMQQLMVETYRTMLTTTCMCVCVCVCVCVVYEDKHKHTLTFITHWRGAGCYSHSQGVRSIRI